MKLHQILLPLLFVVLGGTVCAKPVDPAKARSVASRILRGDSLAVATLGDDLYLVRPVEGTGFVLVSADDCVAPVLAYSTDGTFPLDSIPAHVQAWVDGYSADIAWRRSTGEEVPAEVLSLWDGDSPKGTINLQNSVAPMLTTRWNQSPRYNNMCPADSYGRHAVTGCVATATAQIMKFWEHPIHGRGTHQYHSANFGTLSVNFDTLYPWSSMPASLGYGSSSAQVNAVALLMYHVGVAVEMNYGVSTSGAQILESYGASSERALKSFFRYSPEMRGLKKSNYTPLVWDSIILVEMHYGRPVLYTGFGSDAGHAFVIDGCSTNYNTSTGLRYFHVNWGWGGSYDAYYTLDALNPGGSGTGGSSSNSYNSGCQALIGIKPLYNSLGDSLVLVDVHSADSTTGTVSGNGVYRSDIDSIAVFATPARGYRFDHWVSGNVQNPILGVANGDVVDTAVFLPLGTDTISYSSNTMLDAFRSSSGDTTFWAMRIPADLRAPMRSVSEVQIYTFAGAYYTLGLYQGDTVCPATLLYSYRDYFLGQQWHPFVLDSAVAVDNSRPLWVTVMNDGREHVLPAAAAQYCGNADGSWMLVDGRWQQFKDDLKWYTWMIRTSFVPRDSVECSVTLGMAYRDDTLGLPLPDYCGVSGEGTFAEGTAVTVSATPGVGDTVFRYWLTPWGSRIMENPYTFEADYSIALTAVYGPLVGIATACDGGFGVSVLGRTVSVDAPQDAAIAAYDLQGRCVATGARFTLPTAGVYILRVDGMARKLIVF